MLLAGKRPLGVTGLLVGQKWPRDLLGDGLQHEVGRVAGSTSG